MVPPFLAYAGALRDNKTLLTDAYTQVSTVPDPPCLRPWGEVVCTWK